MLRSLQLDVVKIIRYFDQSILTLANTGLNIGAFLLPGET